MSGKLDRLIQAGLVALGAALLTAPAARAVTLEPGDLIVADQAGSDGNGAIVLVDPLTGAQQVVSSGGFFVDPHDVLLTPRGQLYVTDENAGSGNGAVIRVDPATGDQTLVADEGFFREPQGIAREASGSLVIVDATAGPGNQGMVIRVDPATGVQTAVSIETNFDRPSGIVVEPVTGAVYVSDEDAGAGFRGAVIRVDPTTGAQQVVADNPSPADPIGFNDPEDLALDHTSGDLFVVDEDAHSEPMGSDSRGSVFRVDPATGEATRVSTAGFFVNPSGVSVGINGGILVADPSAIPSVFVGAAIGVDRHTGDQDLIAQGGELRRPNDLFMVPQRCKGRFATMLGTRGRDILTGTPHPDVIVTYKGRDLVNAKGGNDIVCGGAGSDTLGGAKGRDNLFGQRGDDNLFGGTEKDRLYGGKGTDLRRQ